MNPEYLLFVAIVVFFLLAAGLILTALEFSRGSPKQQEQGTHGERQTPHGEDRD